MKSLSIAMVSYHTCPLASQEGKETGGMNVYVLELSKKLGELGVAVDMFTRSQDTKQPHLIDIRHNVRLFHIPAGPETIIPKKQLSRWIPQFSHRVAEELRKEHRKEHYDILHAHYYLSGLAALKINAFVSRPLPLVMTFHTLALMKNLVARDQSERESKTRIGAERRLIRYAQAIIAGSETDKQYLEYLYGAPKQKLSVVVPGVDRSRFKPIDKAGAKRAIGADADHRIILFVGRIEALKGIDVLMYALKILLARNPKLTACLWIVGGDVSQNPTMFSKERERLESLRHELGISTSVKFVGRKRQEELPSYYNAAEVVVMPSHYESFGLAALEAMACGTPVVATNVAGISSLIGPAHGEFITSANNPLYLATQIEQLLTDQHVHANQSQHALTLAKTMTWKTVAEKTLKIYRILAQRTKKKYTIQAQMARKVQ